MSKGLDHAPSNAGIPLLIGLGNDDRRDDRCGLEVVRAVRRALPDRVRIFECRDDTTELLDLWAGVDRVIVVDAVRSGAAAGTLHRLEVGASIGPPWLSGPSTHGLSLAQTMELGRSLGRWPKHLEVYGIEGADFEIGSELTPSVKDAADRLADRLVKEIDATSPKHRGGGRGHA